MMKRITLAVALAMSTVMGINTQKAQASSGVLDFGLYAYLFAAYSYEYEFTNLWQTYAFTYSYLTYANSDTWAYKSLLYNYEAYAATGNYYNFYAMIFAYYHYVYDY